MFLISALDGQLRAESALPTGKQFPYLLISGLGGPDRLSEFLEMMIHVSMLFRSVD
jgi:hypothetical protein